MSTPLLTLSQHTLTYFYTILARFLIWVYLVQTLTAFNITLYIFNIFNILVFLINMLFSGAVFDIRVIKTKLYDLIFFNMNIFVYSNNNITFVYD